MRIHTLSLLIFSLVAACGSTRSAEAPGVEASGTEAVPSTSPSVIYRPDTGATTTNQDGIPQPARADVVTSSDDWIACTGNFSLCYYSGAKPAPGQPDLSCTITDRPHLMANCNCLYFEDAPYRVDINAILDKDVYDATVAACSRDGMDCTDTDNPNQAPVCAAIKNRRMFAGASPTPDSISTFTPALNSAGPPYLVKATTCDAGVYAGCMTAPCVATDQPPVTIGDTSYPIHSCTCPLWKGPYQVGGNIDKSDCVLDGGSSSPGSNTWSAAIMQ